MKRVILLLFLSSFLCGSSRAEDGTNLLFIQPQFGIQAPKIFTQGKTSSYSGQTYSAALLYKIGSDDFAVAPYVSYGLGIFNNTANSASQSEKITENAGTVGVRIYLANLFFGVNYSWLKFKDEATGSTSLVVNDSATALGGSLGLSYAVSSYLGLEFSMNVQNANFNASSGGFSSSAQYLRYGGMIGLSILLPSTPARKGFFRTTRSGGNGI